nr:MAG TPA: hypothetical protein [Bacteriophage sp.]
MQRAFILCAFRVLANYKSCFIIKYKDVAAYPRGGYERRTEAVGSAVNSPKN